MSDRTQIYLAYPVYDKSDARAEASLQLAIQSSQYADVHKHLWIGDSCISRVRNRQISQFWHMKEYEWYMTLDCDIQVRHTCPEDNLFDKLLAWNVDVVGALVSKTNVGPGVQPCASVPLVTNCVVNYNSGLVKMRWLGAGLMLIRRSVVDKMIAAYPQMEYDSTASKGAKEWALYDPMITVMPDGFRKSLSEDWAACQRWLDIGGEIYADTSIRTVHWGEGGYALWPDPPGKDKDHE